MKYFLKKVAVFFVLAAVIDITFGWASVFLRGKARGGQTYKSQHIFKECEDDILILGSSKAAHHYIPDIISDSTGLSCYNCGLEGNGIIGAYARYKMVSARKIPKLVIYEVTPAYDFLQDKGYSSYLGEIRPYTDNKIIKEEYLLFSEELEWLKLWSNMYRNNSHIISYLKDIVKPTADNRGYEPLMGKIAKSTTIKSVQHVKEKAHWDSLKCSLFEQLIKEIQRDGAEIVFIASPSFYSGNMVEGYDMAFDISKKYNIRFVNNMGLEMFNGREDYFQDVTHLNNTGAIEYSKYVANQLKMILSERKI